MYETDFLNNSGLGDKWFSLLRFQPVVDLDSGDILAISTLNFNEFEHSPWPSANTPDQYFEFLSLLMHFWNLPSSECFNRYPLTVKIPARMLSVPGAIKKIQSCVSGSGLWSRQLVLLISETCIEDVPNFSAVLESLARLGVRLSIYDCLARDLSVLSFMGDMGVYAFHLPKSVTHALPASQIGRQYAQGILALAKKLNQVVVLDGVDSLDFLDYARLAGARYVQGELISEPVSAESLCACCQKIRLAAEKK